MHNKPIFYLMTLGLSGCFGEGVKQSERIRHQYGMSVHEFVTMERRKELERRRLREEKEFQRGGDPMTLRDGHRDDDAK